MNILGISDHLTSGACVVVDGQLVAAVNEERLARQKMVMGFPWKSIENALEIAGLTATDIDRVAVASKWGYFLGDYVDFSDGAYGIDEGPAKRLFFDLGSHLSTLRKKLPFLERLYYQCQQPFYARRRARIRSALQQRFNITAPVEFVWHHLAHAACAYYASGFDETLVVTIDGSGDGHCSHVYSVRNGRFEYLHAIPSIDGLGNYYAYVTQICGFKGGKHEGKITGLAAYGHPVYREILDRFIRYQNGSTENVANVFRWGAIDALKRALPDDFERKDLASTIQLAAEDICSSYVAHWLKATGHRRVALAGGVVANVKINQRIHEIPAADEMFIYPAMSDEGLSAGAALFDCAAQRERVAPQRCFDHVYLGPEFSEEEIARALESSGVEFRRTAQPEREIAELIAAGYVIARFNGRMEYGPRALGNRSILYRPDDPSVNDWLNARLQRTEFMPFAPSTLMEHADECFVNISGARDSARFMTVTFDCTEHMRRYCPGVVHIDGTARPQLVSVADNPSYHRIISEFRDITGLPCIVNTSFNIHEEPIVCTPEDAIRAFVFGHLDVLAIGPFLVKNAQADARIDASEPAGRSLPRWLAHEGASAQSHA